MARSTETKIIPKKKRRPRPKVNTKAKYYYSKAAADRVIDFIEGFCTHVEGELMGQPLLLEPWQKKILRKAFGTLRRSDNLRRYRTLYVEVPRKNGKSALASALAAYLLVGDKEGGSQVYSAASSVEQARIVFEASKKMITTSPRLYEACEILRDAIYHSRSQSSYKVLSSVAESQHGKNIHGVVMDELHIFKNRLLYDALITGTGARRQPMTIIITTAGLLGTFAQVIHNYAEDIIKGTLIEDTFCAFIFAASPDDNPFLLKTWKKANPGYGTICKPEFFKMMATRAKNSPSFYNTFLQLHLNIWVGANTAWITGADWNKCNAGAVPLEQMAGRRCWAGLDLATNRDLCAFALFFPATEKEKAICYLFQWAPEETIYTRTLQENVNYAAWVKQGHLFTMPGNANEFTRIVDFVLNDLPVDIDLQAIAYDRWNSNETVISLQNEGVRMEPYGQGLKDMSKPIFALEGMVMRKEINHQGNPLLDWEIGNVVIIRDSSDNMRLDKKHSKDKIDAVAALCMAIGQSMKDQHNPTPKSRYNNGGQMLVIQ